MDSNEFSRREFLKRVLALSAAAALPTILTKNTLSAARPKPRIVGPNERVNLAVCGIGILFSILIVLGVDFYRKHTYTSVILPDAYRITDMKAKEHTSYSVNGDNTDYVYIITVKYEIDGTSYTDTLQILQGTHFATELHARYLADNAPEEVLGNLYYSEKDPSHIGRYGDDSLFVE